MAGRKTKLTPELVQVSKDYLKANDALGQAALLPTIERLALTLGVSRDSLYEWSGKKTKLGKEFSDILEQLKASQADKLIQNGVVGRYNSTITKLMLSKHGYVESQQIDHTTKGQPMPLLGGTTPLPDEDEEESKSE